ncbi:peptidyl-prolyl cis-trans isomerase [Rhizorhabdus dicambivorans]|uniref:Peptidyl-prolyl cis-trans isomerase, EpsD family n=1 Tax=Rhizorhabdus dicambivorans TaxID=1850238 RepID=A0A2A4FZG3_9SPHN|nr:peptidyl-prolyl cis-trans isomerase [Rhizorhabdus dicambivorans]ATE67124.1 hypothetical protein CMV14_04160 [Rhizorhabdus dicambivorans]PCE42822.1 hypothetical protein COO09_08295 [Rhizorhabdus dicambivorans]
MKRARTGALLALALLGGCGKAPKGQVLAIVNGREITAQQLDAEMRDMTIPATIDRRMLTRVVLQGVIDRDLQVEEARRQDLDDTPEYRAQLKRREEELLVSMLGQKAVQTVPMPADEDIRNYIAAHPLQFARRQRLLFERISFTPPKDVARLRAAIEAAPTLEAAAGILQSMAIAGERGQGAIDTAQIDPDLAAKLDKTPAGKPVLLPQGDLLAVAAITGREPIATPPAEARLTAARGVRAEDLLHESQAQVAAARAKAEIQYEPGWAPDKMAR